MSAAHDNIIWTYITSQLVLLNKSDTNCLNAAYMSDQAIPIRTRILLSEDKITLAETTNTDLISDAERTAFLAVDAAVQSCQAEMVGQLSRAFPTILPLFTKYNQMINEATRNLVSRKITWGDFMQERKNMVGELRPGLIAEVQRLASI